MSNFKIIHWNTLADSLSDGFPYINKTYLTWEHRKDLIIKRIKQENADIICLVEIDEKDRSILDELCMNYWYNYVKKNSVDNDEGCLVLVNKRFDILTKYSIILKKGRSQIAIIMKLRDTYNGYTFKLVSTHLKAKPGWEETRLKQCKAIMDMIGQEDCILTGDYNDIPGSLFYQYLTKECGLIDTYKNEERVYTTFKKRETVVCRVIDYIFYRSKTIEPILTIAAPDLKSLPDIGLPTEIHPSDHVLIGAIFDY
jgi:mRNA deadenylase 3'-5' endonuclease subunit Ccr4